MDNFHLGVTDAFSPGTAMTTDGSSSSFIQGKIGLSAANTDSDYGHMNVEYFYSDALFQGTYNFQPGIGSGTMNFIYICSQKPNGNSLYNALIASSDEKVLQYF